MTAYDYSVPAASAVRMLERFGQAVTRRTYTAGTLNQSTGVVTPTTADTTRTGALFDVKPGTMNIRGTLVNVGDKELYLEATAAVSITDHYIIGSTEYVVLSFEEIAPAGTAVLYMLHLRRA